MIKLLHRWPAFFLVLGGTVFFTAMFLLMAVTPKNIFAQTTSVTDTDAFDTKLTTTYIVDQASITRVKHEFTITNRTPTTFIKQYALTTAYPNLTNVTVQENGQNIEANVVVTDSQTSIAITFPTEVVGEGKTRSFTIEYTNPDLAIIGGKVLEIHVPELSDPEQYDEHSIRLITPTKYGKPIRSNPGQTSSSISPDGVVTLFTNLQGKSLSALFGNTQIYDLTLRYNLENLSSSEAYTQIALPPNTSFQKLHYHTLDPRPQEIKRDEDGNWIAKYHLPPGSVTTVYLTAIAKVTLESQPSNNMPTPQKQHQAGDKYWEIRDAQIAAQADLHRTPEEIFNYVTKTLTYNNNIQGIPPRLGAAGALEKPEQAVCQEFTDLFIALARANNIPTRRLTGYAYSQNDQLRPLSLEGDVLHAWPEYYDNQKELWIPVDPTWANTTGGVDYFHQFDLNHIVFAINGTSSETPYPAGSYKATDTESKDVEVSFADTFPEIDPNFVLQLEPTTIIGVPLPGFYTLKITNKTGQAWYDIIAEFDNNDNRVSVNHGENLTIPSLLPYQTQSFTITAHTSQWQIIKNHPVIVRLAAKSGNEYVSEQKQIIAGPTFIGYFKNPQVLFGLGIGLTLVTLIGGSILVFRRT